MIVTDDNYISALFKRYLEGVGYKTKIAKNALVALDMLKDNMFEIIIIDKQISVLNNVNLLEDTSDISINSSIIVIAGEYDENSVNLENKDMILGYLYEPYDVGDINNLLKKAEIRKKINDGNNKRILVVDDEIIVQRILKKILLEEAYEVHCVSSLDKAIEYVKNNDYDLVLLDLKLEGIDGIGTLKKMRVYDAKIPVILISGYLTLESIEKASKYGIFSYIRKPFEINDLRHKIKRALIYSSEIK